MFSFIANQLILDRCFVDGPESSAMFTFVPASYSMSEDCPNLINFARDLNMRIAQPSIWSSLQVDCCTASGVTCTSQRVSQITWSSISLNGTLNSTAIPPLLTHLVLPSNQISGTLPAVWPDQLQFLDLTGNKITGVITSLPNALTFLRLPLNRLTGSLPTVLPIGLTHLELDGNNLGGDLPVFPSSLLHADLGWPNQRPVNRFTGTLRLSKPTHFVINDNWITDVIIQNISALTNCDISNTPLLGNPRISGLTICTQTGLYFASTLPKTITTSHLALTTTFSKASTISTGMVSSLVYDVTTLPTTPILSTIVLPYASTTSDGLFSANTHLSIASNESVLSETVIFSFPVLKPVFTIGDILLIILRSILDVIISVAVIRKTPFKREWRNKGKRKTKSLFSFDVM